MQSQPEKELGVVREKAVEFASEATPSRPAVLSAEEYNAVIQGLSPTDVRLALLSFSLGSPVHSGPLSSHARFDAPKLEGNVERAPGGEVYVMASHECKFAIAASDGSIAAEGQAVYRVRIKVSFEPPQIFWDMFLPRNMKLYTHPAVRDLIASLAARSSLVATPLASISITQNIQSSS